MAEAAHLRYQSKLFIGSSHSWALQKLLPFSADSAVLDIGPGSGVIGAALKERGFTDLSAVEIDAEARDHVKPIYNTVSDSIEHFGSKRFDIILLLDVIEHMAEPEKFLSRAAQALKDGGIILLSVPNIAHWSVRFQLLFGFFCYTNRGLLDRTHLQFFTRSRVKNIPSAVPALENAELNASIPPVELVVPKAISDSRAFEVLSECHLLFARTLPGMFAYQHLCVLKKR